MSVGLRMFYTLLILMLNRCYTVGPGFCRFALLFHKKICREFIFLFFYMQTDMQGGHSAAY